MIDIRIAALALLAAATPLQGLVERRLLLAEDAETIVRAAQAVHWSD